MLLLDYWPLGRFHSLESAVQSLRSTVHGPQSIVRRPQANGAHAARKSQIVYRILLEKFPFLALSAASSLVTIRGHESLGALVSAEELPVSYGLANAVVAYATYLRKVVWPVDLSVFYLHPGRWPASAVIGSAMLLLAITVLAL